MDLEEQDVVSVGNSIQIPDSNCRNCSVNLVISAMNI